MSKLPENKSILIISDPKIDFVTDAIGGTWYQDGDTHYRYIDKEDLKVSITINLKEAKNEMF